MLGLTIGVLGLLLSSHLLRSTAARQKRPGLNIDVGFRRVSTFGGLAHCSPDKSPLPCTGSSGRALVIILVLAVFLATGMTVKIAWDLAIPDIRSAYVRAYEYCAQEGVSRWNKQEVDRCVEGGVRHGIRICHRTRSTF